MPKPVGMPRVFPGGRGYHINGSYRPDQPFYEKTAACPYKHTARPKANKELKVDINMGGKVRGPPKVSGLPDTGHDQEDQVDRHGHGKMAALHDFPPNAKEKLAIPKRGVTQPDMPRVT